MLITLILKSAVARQDIEVRGEKKRKRWCPWRNSNLVEGVTVINKHCAATSQGTGRELHKVPEEGMNVERLGGLNRDVARSV